MHLKKLVNDPDLWRAFVEELNLHISASHKTMETTYTDDKVLYREQGKIELARKLMQLKDKLKNG